MSDTLSSDDFQKLNEDSGVLKKLIKEGTGITYPVAEETILCHYVGTYHGGDEHGKVFDSSRDRNEPFKFKLGCNEVIPAWELLMPTMKKGEICELITTPDYAYKDGKTLKFNIELLNFIGTDISRDMDGSAYLSKISKSGQTFFPTLGANAQLSIQAICDGVIFDERDIDYVIGVPDSVSLPIGVDLAVRKMYLGDKCRVRLSGISSLCEEDFDKFKLKKDSELEYIITLNNFERIKSITVMNSFDEQIQQVEILRKKANDHLKAGRYVLALDMYKNLEHDLSYVNSYGVEENKTLQANKLALFLNMALANLKLNNFLSCIEYCDKAIEIDPASEKAIFRKGEAHLLRKDHEEALPFFKNVVRKHPENVSAAAKIKLCENVIKKALEEEKKMYKNAFKKLKEPNFNSKDSTSVITPPSENSNIKFESGEMEQNQL